MRRHLTFAVGAGVLTLAIPAIAEAHTTTTTCAGFTPTQLVVHIDATSFASSGAGNGGQNKVTYGIDTDGVQTIGSFQFPGATGNADVYLAVSNGAHHVIVTDKWAATDTRDGHSQARQTLFDGSCSTKPQPPAPPTPPAPPVPPAWTPPVDTTPVPVPPVEEPAAPAPVVTAAPSVAVPVAAPVKRTTHKASSKAKKKAAAKAKRKHHAPHPRKPKHPFGITG